MSRHSLLFALFVAATCSFVGEAVAGPQYVIEITVDALGAPYLQSLVAGGQLPSFRRLETEGAWTTNARCDYDLSVTMPNHISVVTGRSVYGTGGDGHNWSVNSWDGTTTIQGNNGGTYIKSVFDVAHDAGRTTAIWAGKTKLGVIPASYGAKVDYAKIVDATSNPAGPVQDFIATMSSTPYNYSLLHLGDPDFAGSWGSTNYNNAVKTVDGYLGSILAMVENPSSILYHNTAIIVTADHGGSGNDHSNAAAYSNYTIPFIAWGTGVSAGRDLYGLNSGTRTDPGSLRPAYGSTMPQPIRNSDGANLALDLLGLGAIPGSKVNAAQDLAVQGNGPVAKQVIAYTAFNETPIGLQDWTPGTGDTELGFTTTVLGQVGINPVLGTYDSTTSPRRFRMRSYEAEATFATVDIAPYDRVTASIDVLIKNTTYESDDYVRAVLSNGTESIQLVNLSGGELNANYDVFLHYEAAIPDSWTHVVLTLSSHTNSSAGAEGVDFDNIFFTGVPVPEPNGAAMLLTAALAVGWARGRESRRSASGGLLEL